MTDAALRRNELLRLDECAREPIRTPGSIQSHGVLFGIDPTGTIVLASENAAEHLGSAVAAVFEPALLAAIADATAIDPVRVTFGGEPYDAIVHRQATRTLVELEPAVLSLEYARTGVVAAIQRLAAVREAGELRAVAASSIRALTGFDRVMVYHFHDDGHGEVVAEDRAEGMERYLGLHFPSSDIPPQARELYLSKLSRAIVRTDDPGIPLVALDGDAAAVDLSVAELRSVSPYHLQYMRNMGQASTVSFSLVRDGALVGMITCAHRTRRRLPVLLRRSLEVLASQVAMQLGSMLEIDTLRHAVDVRERRAALLAPLFASDDVAAALLSGPATVLDLVPADGVIVSLTGTVSTLGSVPSAAVIHELIDAVADARLVSSALEAEHPRLAALLPEFAGILVIPLGESGNCLIFLREETITEVDWLGDLGDANRPDPLSPRLSFSAWKQSVSGHSTAWGVVAAEAAELGRELEGALLRRSEARLAELAMRDALTGLHNRRYLTDRLDRALAGGSDVALIFVDLDHFKAVNDTHGHDAGDAVIIEVGRRLVASSRAQDAVARLGGDEFVVVCENASAANVHTIAERIVATVGAPIAVRDAVLTVTASCGVVGARPGATGQSLLDDADAAMYRAKAAGRNRVAD